MVEIDLDRGRARQQPVGLFRPAHGGHHLMPSPEQRAEQVSSDKAVRAGEQNPHGRKRAASSGLGSMQAALRPNTA